MVVYECIFGCEGNKMLKTESIQITLERLNAVRKIAIIESIGPWQEIRINENFIRQLHKDFLVYSEKDEWYRGNYKTLSSRVAVFDEKGEKMGRIFETATPL
jgi:hypothetical protein